MGADTGMILRLIKMLTCHHDYRFVGYLHGDPINIHDGKRFEYECVKCGMPKWFSRPLNCCGCKHLHDNSDGSVSCDSPCEKTCLKTDGRLWWEEPTERK